jgi:glycosyltransferase involved in cell wall biosynthesis
MVFMKIWHIGSSPSPKSVDGVNAVVWLVAQEQARLGHSVTLLVDAIPDYESQLWADKIGIRLKYITASMWGYDSEKLHLLLKSDTPDIVHIHSVFLPRLATLGKTLVKQCIPYIVTPHAIHPQLLRRGCLKKQIYSWLIEKPRFLQAAAITGVTPREAEDIQAFVPNYSNPVRWIPNPINLEDLQDRTWAGKTNTKRIVYLGRFDVLHKGIDILIEIARFLPSDIEIHLYGTQDAKTKEWMEQLTRNLPPNIFFHSPVFGAEKARILANASLYIQTSRWEVFGNSIAEAMYSGVPCAIAATINLAEVFQKHNLGLVLPASPQESAKLITEVLSQPTQLQFWSRQAKEYAQQHFKPQTIAQKYLKLYEEVSQR